MSGNELKDLSLRTVNWKNPANTLISKGCVFNVSRIMRKPFMGI